MEEPQLAVKKAILRIVDILSTLPNVVHEQLKAGKRYAFEDYGTSSGVLIIKSGSFSVYRRRSDLFLGTISAPNVTSFSEALYNNSFHYIKADEACEAILVYPDDFIQAAEDFDLWEDICLVLSTNLISIFVEQNLNVADTAYEVVKNYLLELADMDDAERYKYNVANYIVERSALSRSAVMAILSDLRKGEFIKMQRAKLISVGKLPKGY